MENRYKFVDEKKEHLHTLDGKPLIGTSSVLSIVSKPLTWWAAGKAVEKFGWVNPKLSTEKDRLLAAMNGRKAIVDMTDAEYAKLLQAAYRAHDTTKKDAAEAGTDMHAELEQYVRVCMMYWGKPQLTVSEHKAVKIFADWAVENVQRFLWSEMHCWSESLWLGGISDVGALLKDGRTCIIDFKSSKEAYASQFWQIAGYDLQISENGGYTAEGERVFSYREVPVPEGRVRYEEASVYFIIPFGAAKPEPVPFADVEGAREAFKSALVLYKANQNYNG
jgi:hypothetical protein